MTEPETKPTEIIGDFEIYKDRLLGKGAWGEVYRGKQVSLEREVAVKILKKELSLDEEFVRRFMREAKCIAQLVDENIIQVYGAGKHEGAYYFAMEFVHGMPLQKLLDRGRKFAAEEIVYIGLCVSKALKAAWGSPAQIVHRDIKPSNIMVSFTSSIISSGRKSATTASESLAFLDIDIKESRIKVMDFGLAKVATASGQDQTMVGTIIGTPKYISPEQGLGNPADIRSDIYSLGIVMYELATGRIPFVSDSAVSLVRHHIYDTAIPPRQFNPDIPADLESVIMKCIQKDPNHRYGNPSELIADLEALRQASTPLYAAQTMANIGATMIAHPETAKPKKPLLAIAITAIVIIAAALGAYFVFIKRPAKDDSSVPTIVHKTTPDASALPVITATPKTEPLSDMPVLTKTAATPSENPAQKLAQLCHDMQVYIEYGTMASLDEAGKLLIEAKKINENDENVIKWEKNLKQKRDEVLEVTQKRKLKEEFDHFVGLAEGKKGEKDWQSALDYYFTALSKSPSAAVEAEIKKIKDNIELINNYEDIFKNANTFDRNGELNKAKDEYTKLLDLYPKVKDLYKTPPTNPTDCVNDCKQKIDDKEFLGLQTEGKEFYDKKKYSSAKEILRKALAIKPSDKTIRDYIEDIDKQLITKDNMVFVEEGTFLMGEKGRNEKEVFVASFYMDIYEVTNEDYKKFYDWIKSTQDHSRCSKDEKPNKKHLPQFWVNENYNQAEANLPIVGIDWFDAYAYASWCGKRLPSAAEWEKAARGLDGRIYPGDWKSASEIKANIRGIGAGALAAVKSFPQDLSPYGCFDMMGNVSEWTSDFLDITKNKDEVIVMGGNWRKSPMPVYKIDSQLRTDFFNNLGFRCAKSVK